MRERWPAGTGDETPLGSVRGGYVERRNEVGIVGSFRKGSRGEGA